MTHVLADARGQMREGHTSAQWELIAREKVVRTLLETGEFTADDLADLNIPVEYRRHVHGAATGHYSGEEPYMEFVGLRKSERASRKGGKNQLFSITAKGRRELPRLLRDLRTELTQLAGSDAEGSTRKDSCGVGPVEIGVAPGQNQPPLAGVGADHSGDCEGGEGASVPTSLSVGIDSGESAGAGSPAHKSEHDAPPATLAAGPGSPDHCITTGPSTGGNEDQGVPGSSSLAGGDAQLLGLGDPKRRVRSMYDAIEDAAA